MLGVVASLVLQLSGDLERTCFPGSKACQRKPQIYDLPKAGRLVKASREQTKGLTSSGNVEIFLFSCIGEAKDKAFLFFFFLCDKLNRLGQSKQWKPMLMESYES